MPRLPRRSKAASRASRRRKPGPRAVSRAICPTPVTQNTTVDARLCHACHVKSRWMSPSAVCVRVCVCLCGCGLLCVVVVCVWLCVVVVCVCACWCVVVVCVFFLHSFSEEKSRACRVLTALS